MEKQSNKRVKLMIIGVAILVIGLVGITYAFFNYTRIGMTNTIRVGKISFSSNQNQTINLTNVFPISSSEASSDTENSDEIIITITGDTTYTEGIEYLITTVDVNNTINNKEIPISIVVTASNGLGTADASYFDNRGDTSEYKVLSRGTIKDNGEVLVGYITNGQTGVNGTVSIKAYIDEDKILISDTYDGSESGNMGTPNSLAEGKTMLTTTEWNSIQNSPLSFKIKVEANQGIWVNEPLTAYERINRNVINPATPINFANVSSNSNGKGLYILPGTENDTYPIMYYRGAINNNNVSFGGYCWQMVRTTDTGGIKMIYNGEPAISGSGENTTYNCGVTRPFEDSIMTTISIFNPAGYYYADDYEIISIQGNNATYKLKSKNNPLTQVAIASTSDAASNIPTIAANYPYTCMQTSSNGTCSTLYKVVSHANETNANVYASTSLSSIDNNAFNSHAQSLSDVGYMSNARYVYSPNTPTSGAYFGTSVEYDDFDSNGTYEYRLVNDGSGSVSTTLDADHHYSCNMTTCTTIRYYYYATEYLYRYISLTGGEKIEDALYKMTGNGSLETKTKNSGYELNNTDSSIKTLIENWFKTNLTNEVDAEKTNYASYLEDTIWCNDRSYNTQTGNIATYSESGWNPNGGTLNETLHFGTYNRYYNGWYSTTNVPSLTCPNETDRFSVSSRVAHLNYPVGLLTVDEMIMAGASGNTSTSNGSYYLYTGSQYWTMSPAISDGGSSREFRVESGNVTGLYVTSTVNIRPAISLKNGVEFEYSGDGTPTNPYVVKYN